MNTTENNKIIAEFMNWKVQKRDFPNCKNPITKEWEFNPVFKYHLDWNLLMEVVEKINQFEDQRFSCLINSMDCNVFDNVKNKVVASSFGRFTPDQLKESIYNACVEFIKWYNQQQN